MADIRISVITSLYRCASFLEQFLIHYSRIGNIHECELILVHNDATEEELDILNRFIQPHMKVLHLLVKREGLYASWNRAIMLAKGEYLAIWNVDDIRTPDSLAAQKAALEQSKAVMCYGDFYGTRTYGPFAETLYSYGEYDTCKKEAFNGMLLVVSRCGEKQYMRRSDTLMSNLNWCRIMSFSCG